MPDASGKFAAKARVQTTITVNDQSGHDMSLAEISGIQQSADQVWNDAQCTYWAVSDLYEGNGTQKGYFVNAQKDGARACGTFEGKVTTRDGKTAVEGTWKYTGGYGKFQGITGNGTFKTRLLSPTDAETTWQGSYALAAAARR